MKVFLCNPPTGSFIRDERCQIDVCSRLAENIREPIQILYLAGLLKKYGHEVFLRDYSFSRFSVRDVLADMERFVPDFFYLETTQGTFSHDLDFIRLLSKSNITFPFIVKAPFLDFTYFEDKMHNVNLNNATKAYFLIKNFEITIKNIISAKTKDSVIDNVYILDNNKVYQTKNKKISSDFKLDDYPLPPRYFLSKNDYLRPDTGEPIAYIYASRGCPYDCIFCLAPVCLGKKVESRSVDSVIAEIEDCVDNYRISNFFFRSDTFTFDKKWVMDFCQALIDREIKIKWGTNSRADKEDLEMFKAMKKAGCDIVGLGIESGSDFILNKIKKSITVKDIKCIHRLIKKSGINTFFHCIVGFPWDNQETILETKKLILELEPDFIEVNVPYPLKGTELYSFAEKNNLFVSKDLESYSHIKPILRTFSLKTDEISRLRKDLIASFYLRPKYIIRKLKSIRHPRVFFNYAKWGCKLMKKIFL